MVYIVKESVNGKVKARVWVDGRTLSKTFTTKGEAWSWIDAQEAVKAGAPAPPPIVATPAAQPPAASVSSPRPTGTTLDQFLDAGGFVTTHLRPTTAATYNSLLAHFRKRFGSTPLAAITHVDMQRWLLSDVAPGRRPLTVKHIAKSSSAVMASAVVAGLIASNPAVGLKTPRDDKPHEAHFISPPEMDRLSAAMDLRYRVFVYLAGWAGLRIGEALALRWGRIDLFAGKLEVRESVAEADGKQYVGAPKTKAGRRTVSLPSVA